jgi:NAD(P)-dependent dehydrogenase (short-subunit alcohol dehydrogenase family)
LPAISSIATIAGHAVRRKGLPGHRRRARHRARHREASVNIGSTRARQSEPDTTYSASKGGIAALTHSLALSLGPDVRVNCIEPGWIATDALGPRDERKPPRSRRVDHSQHPAGRVGGMTRKMIYR